MSALRAPNATIRPIVYSGTSMVPYHPPVRIKRNPITAASSNAIPGLVQKRFGNLSLSEQHAVAKINKKATKLHLKTAKINNLRNVGTLKIGDAVNIGAIRLTLLQREEGLALVDHRGNEYALKNINNIGRGDDQDIILRSHYVSREHAFLIVTGPREVIVFDKGSRNSTTISKAKIVKPKPIKSKGITRSSIEHAIAVRIAQIRSFFVREELEVDSTEVIARPIERKNISVEALESAIDKRVKQIQRFRDANV